MNEHLGYFDENRDRICELADNQDKELEALLQTEVELADFQKVKVSLSEKVNMSALDLMELEDFIEFTEKPQKEKKYGYNYSCDNRLNRYISKCLFCQ